MARDRTVTDPSPHPTTVRPAATHWRQHAHQATALPDRRSAIAIIASQRLHLVFAVFVGSQPLDACDWGLTALGFGVAALRVLRIPKDAWISRPPPRDAAGHGQCGGITTTPAFDNKADVRVRFLPELRPASAVPSTGTTDARRARSMHRMNPFAGAAPDFLDVVVSPFLTCQPHRTPERSVNIAWQIQHEILRSRLDDTMRAARYAHRNAESHRRPMRRIAAAMRWVSDWLVEVLPDRGQDSDGRAAATDHRDFDPADLRLTVSLVDDLDDQCGTGDSRPTGRSQPIDGFSAPTAPHRRPTDPVNGHGNPCDGRAALARCPSSGSHWPAAGDLQTTAACDTGNMRCTVTPSRELRAQEQQRTV